MTRRRVWWICFGLVALLGLTLFGFLSPHSKLLTDSDTQLILTEIQKQHDPWRWFHHDWPLDNHFYRPVVSELFEWEWHAHPTNDYLWGLTCDLLAFFTTLGLFWTLREITDNPAVSTLSTLLFIGWQVNLGDQQLLGWGILSTPLVFGALAVAALGIWRQRHILRKLGIGHRAEKIVVKSRTLTGKETVGFRWALLVRLFRVVWSVVVIVAPAALVWYWLGSSEIEGITRLGFRMLAWIPGRTASSMTVFAFVATAAWARYMRLLPRRVAMPSALDTPNTRNSEPPRTEMPSVGWPILAMLAEGLGLLCYEQAVIIPALLGLIGLLFHFRGALTRWWLWGVPFGAVLLAYLELRHQFIPPTRSFYYNEQKRTAKTAFDALQRYLLVFWADADEVRFYIQESAIMFVIAISPWTTIFHGIAASTSLWQMRRRWQLAGFAWLASTITYLPMAFFKDFEHYHYWSMAFRALFDIMMVWIAVDLTVIAVSPQGRQAPRRRVPAPGSLAHP